ncbi:MAG: hypothetical protein KBA31_18770 [Alphaproteobacteria bacterium]|nr:hypothetical protein [Alphaproteobacteria bacterium]
MSGGDSKPPSNLGDALSNRLKGIGATARAFPVFDLRRGTASTFFCVPARIGAAGNQFGHWILAQHDEASLASIDLAFLDDTIAYARRFAEQNIMAAIGTTVSFSTIARAQSRTLYLEKLNAAREQVVTPLVVKVDLIPPGAPSARLGEIVTTLRAAVRRVFVTVPDSRDRMWSPGAIGAAGLGITLTPQDDAESAQKKAQVLNNLCASQGAISYVDGVVFEEVAEALVREGVRFGAGPALSLQMFPLNGGLPKVPLPARKH